MYHESKEDSIVLHNEERDSEELDVVESLSQIELDS